MAALSDIAAAARIQLGSRYPSAKIRPGGEVCWCCNSPMGRQRGDRTVGFYECPFCDVWWYAGTEELAL